MRLRFVFIATIVSFFLLELSYAAFTKIVELGVCDARTANKFGILSAKKERQTRCFEIAIKLLA